MKHIFLTGAIQCGKSTLIQSILHQGAEKLVPVGGFLTYFTSRDAQKTLYLGNAAIYASLLKTTAPPALSPLHLHHALQDAALSPCVAAEFDGMTRPKLHLDAFDRYGRACIEEGLARADTLSRDPSVCPILVLDECGYLESHAAAFQQTVLRALDTPVPILGVVRQMTAPCWLDAVRNHPDTVLVSVTEENRDALVSELTSHFLSCL